MWTDCFWTPWRTWSQGRNELTQEVPCEQIVPEHMRWLEAKEWTHPGSPMWRDCPLTICKTWSQGRNKLTQEVPCEEIVPEHPWGCEEVVPEHSGRLGSQGRNELTQEVPCEQIVPEHPWGCEEIVPEHSGGLGSQGRNELTQEVPCEEIVPYQSVRLEAKEEMNSPRKSHVNRLFLNTLEDVKRLFLNTLEDLNWKRNELTQEVPCEQIVPEHSGGFEAKEGMNSPRKFHVKRLFLNTLGDLKPRKEWTHPGSPMWTDCSSTLWRTWTQKRNELTQEVPCEQIVSEHYGGLEAKEGMNSPRKSHVNRLFLNTQEDSKPRKEWAHPGSPMWTEVVSEHPGGLEAKEGMNSPRKSHVKRLLLNTWDDLKPRKEWTHPGSPMWRDCFWTPWRTWTHGRNELTQEVPCEQDCSWTHEMTWSQGRNELIQEVPCEEIVSEHPGGLEAKEGMNSPRKSHVNRLFLNTWDDLNPRNELTQEVPCEEIVP